MLGQHPRYGRFLMARTAITIQREIDRLKGAVAAGVLSVSVDGQTTTFDSFDGLKRRIASLENELAIVDGGQTMAKPRFINCRLGG